MKMYTLQCKGSWGSYGHRLNMNRVGALATVFQTDVYAILACSDYCRSANMHNMTICICSDSKAALLALSSYTISSKLLHQCRLSLQDLSNNNRVRLFWVPGHCDIKGNEDADRLARMGSDSHWWMRQNLLMSQHPQSCGLLSKMED
jgi:ribonuclease HI